MSEAIIMTRQLGARWHLPDAYYQPAGQTIRVEEKRAGKVLRVVEFRCVHEVNDDGETQARWKRVGEADHAW